MHVCGACVHVGVWYARVSMKCEICVCAVQVYDGCGVGVHVCVCARGGLQHLFLLMTFTFDEPKLTDCS